MLPGDCFIKRVFILRTRLARSWTAVTEMKKRTVNDISEDLYALEKAAGILKRQSQVLRHEWHNHPDNIRKQLELWKIPKTVIDSVKITVLVPEYDPCVDEDDVGAGTAMIQQEEWSLDIEIDDVRDSWVASKWTGESSWNSNFEDIDDDGEHSWESALQENEGVLSKAIAAMGLSAFWNNGEPSILNALLKIE